MSVESGAGGYITVASTRFDVTEWTLDKDPRNVESGTSAQTGTRMTAVKTHPKWTVKVPYDSAAGVEAAGLIQGSVITVTLKLGAGTVFYTVASTTVGHIKVVTNSNNDVVRYDLDGEGGDVSGPA